MRTISRYSNRKLYDRHESRYITLGQLHELVRVGEDVRVIDKASERDLTSATLLQAIFESEKRSPKLPIAALAKIIRSGLPA